MVINAKNSVLVFITLLTRMLFDGHERCQNEPS